MSFITPFGDHLDIKFKVKVIDSRGRFFYSEVQNLNMRYGTSPNEISFFIPYQEGEDETILPFNIENENPLLNLVKVYFYSEELEATHYFSLVSYSLTRRGNRRGVSYRGIDWMRGFFLRNYPIVKSYNNIAEDDIFNPERDLTKFGLWFTNENGTLIFEPLLPSDDNPYALMDAYHAIIDLFYTPLRTHSLNNYPKLIIDNLVEQRLKDFYISEKNYNPSNQLNTIAEILGEIGNKYEMFAYSRGFLMDDQFLIITKKGNGPPLYAAENKDISTSFPEFCKDNHDSVRNFVVVKDDSTVNTSNQKDAVQYRGAPRQYYVEHAPLIPAWDWWNDYNLIVRKRSNNEVIPFRLADGTLNSAYPNWMNGWTLAFEDISKTLLYDSANVSENQRLHTAQVVSVLWGQFLSAFIEAKKNTSTPLEYIVNLNVMDALYLNPNDPIHLHRFKRYIALKAVSENGSVILPSSITPETGWDDLNLPRYRNIESTLVSGRRHDLKDVYVSSLLEKIDTYKITIPPLVEGLLPDYYDKTYDKKFGISEFALGWKQLEGANIDYEEGFFIINDVQRNSVYFDKSKVQGGELPPLDYTNSYLRYLVSSYLGGSISYANRNGVKIKPYYTTPVMKAGGPLGAIFKSEFIPFRTNMRATFYYSRDRKHSQNKDYDQVNVIESSNDIYLQGIYPNISITPDTRIETLFDHTMVKQSTERSVGFNDPEITYLEGQVVSRYTDRVPGRVHVILSWKHRDDSNKLRDKAIKRYEEVSQPEVGGTLDILEGLYLGSSEFMEAQGISNMGLGMLYHNGVSKPISEVSTSLGSPLRTTLGFDFHISRIGDKYNPERPFQVRATENFRSLVTPKKDQSGLKQVGTALAATPNQDDQEDDNNFDSLTGQQINIPTLPGALNMLKEFAASIPANAQFFTDYLINQGPVEFRDSKITQTKSEIDTGV